MNKCRLDPDINECQYFKRENSTCLNPNTGCGYFEKQEGAPKKESYQRQVKWFEQYYK